MGFCEWQRTSCLEPQPPPPIHSAARRGPTSQENGWTPPIRARVRVRLDRWTEPGGDQSKHTYANGPPVPALPPCPSAWPGERKAKRGGQRWLGSGMRPNGTLMPSCMRSGQGEETHACVASALQAWSHRLRGRVENHGWRWPAPSRIGGWQLSAAPARARRPAAPRVGLMCLLLLRN